MFHCKVLDIDNGKFVVKEILNFYQDDLEIDDVLDGRWLDEGEEILVWEGKNCSDEEKEKSMQLASVWNLSFRLVSKFSDIFT